MMDENQFNSLENDSRNNTENSSHSNTQTSPLDNFKAWFQAFRSDKRTKRVGIIALSLFGLGLISFFGLFALVYFGAFGELPKGEELSDIQHHNSSEIYSSDGKMLGKYYIENRSNVDYENISPDLLKALVATEDARFYEHGGVDMKSMLRVAFKSILLRDKSAGGGSTISQQLAKNLFPREDFSILSLPVSKFKEMIIATRLEDTYEKEEILALYLNTVPFGEKVYGVSVASQRFFNTNAKRYLHRKCSSIGGDVKSHNSL